MQATQKACAEILHNLKNKLRLQVKDAMGTLESALKALNPVQATGKIKIQVCREEDGELKGIFMTLTRLDASAHHFRHIVLVDSTYLLVEIRNKVAASGGLMHVERQADNEAIQRGRA